MQISLRSQTAGGTFTTPLLQITLSLLHIRIYIVLSAWLLRALSGLGVPTEKHIVLFYRLRLPFKDPSFNIFLILYATPTEPGRCIHIGCQMIVRNDNKASSLAGVYSFLLKKIPIWLMHVMAPLFLFQASDRYPVAL